MSNSAFTVSGTGGGGGALGVSSVTGTANQVTVTPTTGAVVASLPASVIITTSVKAGNIQASINTLSTTDANGNLVVAPNGLGAVQINNGTNAVPLQFYNAAGTHHVGVKAGVLAADTTWTLPTTDSVGTQALVSNGAGVMSWASFAAGGAGGAPTVSKALTAGTATGTGGFVSGTYTTPANVRYLEVTMVGGGGGGGGSLNLGGTGGTTTFGAGYLACTGGSGGGPQSTGFGPGGGSQGIASGATTGLNINGNGGFSSNSSALYGGMGGSTMFGGLQPNNPTGNGSASIANSGAGGGGSLGAGGGGAGGCIYREFIAAPAATYAYSVGAAGAGSGGGSYVGGNGGSGFIMVTEYY